MDHLIVDLLLVLRFLWSHLILDVLLVEAIEELLLFVEVKLLLLLVLVARHLQADLHETNLKLMDFQSGLPDGLFSNKNWVNYEVP
jgi:hypothetical protein